MKLVFALVATLFAVTTFASDAPKADAKKEAPKADAKAPAKAEAAKPAAPAPKKEEAKK
jgi:hypothetical protein